MQADQVASTERSLGATRSRAAGHQLEHTTDAISVPQPQVFRPILHKLSLQDHAKHGIGH